MSLYEALSGYSSTDAIKVTLALMLVFAIRIVGLPFALITLLVNRTAGALGTYVSTVPHQAGSVYRVSPGRE